MSLLTTFMYSIIQLFPARPQQRSLFPKRMLFKTLWLSVLVGGISAVSTRGAAQTLFEWPSNPIHIDRYTTVETCLALVGRVRDSLEGQSPVWRDTLVMTQAEVVAPLPAPVLEVAGRCAAQFDPKTASLSDFHPLVKLYLLAGRDSDAQMVATRRLQAIADTNNRERAAVLDTLVGALINQGSTLSPQPARIVLAEPYLNELVASSHVLWQHRANALHSFVVAARKMKDTVRMKRASEQYLTLVQSLPPVEQRKEEYEVALQLGYRLTAWNKEEQFLDSLRRGTAGYVTLRQAEWSRLSGEKSRVRFIPNGKPAPHIEGEFWFAREDTTVHPPVKGKVSLIVFMDQRSCLMFQNCWVSYTILKRLAEKFPELQMTLVTRTYGHFGALEPPTPAEEATYLGRWWTEERRLPGMLVVKTTDFWRLPNFDRRRIDRDDVNMSRYSFDRQWPVRPQVGYLVDRSGTIVELLPLQREVEEYNIRIVDAVFAQAAGGQ